MALPGGDIARGETELSGRDTAALALKPESRGMTAARGHASGEAPGREALEGTASGALSMALFGAIWALVGAGALGGVAGTALCILSLTLAAPLCLGAARVLRAARRLPSDDSREAGARRRRLSRRFNLVFGLQAAAIALAVVLLGR
ncbi:MAG: hypothetical protein ACRDSJ_16265 [Rubrobacteraceae bacterium]